MYIYVVNSGVANLLREKTFMVKIKSYGVLLK